MSRDSADDINKQVEEENKEFYGDESVSGSSPTGESVDVDEVMKTTFGEDVEEEMDKGTGFSVSDEVDKDEKNQDE